MKPKYSSGGGAYSICILNIFFFFTYECMFFVVIVVNEHCAEYGMGIVHNL